MRRAARLTAIAGLALVGHIFQGETARAESVFWETFEKGKTSGQSSGVQFEDTSEGKVAVFSQKAASRLVYPFEDGTPHEGIFELRVKVDRAYSYKDFAPVADAPCALVFSTDIHGGDVTYPGSAWFWACRNGDLKINVATAKHGKGPPQQLVASATAFRFGQWHSIGFSAGSKGQALMLDGREVASNPAHRQPLGAGGTQDRQADHPTFGEAVSSFWKPKQHTGGFEGRVSRVRISATQRDWCPGLTACGPVVNKIATARLESRRSSAVSAANCDEVKSLDAQLGGPAKHTECLRVKRLQLAASADCEGAANLDRQLGGTVGQDACHKETDRRQLEKQKDDWKKARAAALESEKCDDVRTLDAQIGDSGQHSACLKESERRKAARERATLMQKRTSALTALSCEEVKALDALLGGDEHSGCAFAKLMKSGQARELYLEATKLESTGQRDKARQLYVNIIDRFPKDDFAVKAAEAMANIARVEAVERSNMAATNAAQAAKAAAEAEGQANRDAIERARRDAQDREWRAQADHCRGYTDCRVSCMNLPYGNSQNYCYSQCRSRFAGC